MANEEKKESAGVGLAGSDLTLLEQIEREGRRAHDADQAAGGRDLIGEFVREIMSEGLRVSRDTVVMIETRIARIDELIAAQLNEIVASPEFQRLASTWRAIHELVSSRERLGNLRILLDVGDGESAPHSVEKMLLEVLGGQELSGGPEAAVETARPLTKVPVLGGHRYLGDLPSRHELYEEMFSDQQSE